MLKTGKHDCFDLIEISTDTYLSGVASIAIRSLAHAGEVLTDRQQQEECLQVFEKINKETGWRIGFVYKELKEKWGWQEEPSPEQYAQTHTAALQEKERQERQQQMQQAHAAQQQQQQQEHMRQQSMQLQQGFMYNSQNLAQNMSLPPVQLTPPHQTPQQQHQQHQQPQQQQQQQQQQHQQQQHQQQQQQPPKAAGKQNKKMPSGILNPMYAKADFNLPQHPYQDVYVAPSSGYGHPQGGVWWGS
jgi:hypothetical protein